MKVTFEQINEIVKSLPISYYSKRKTNMSLSNEENSYYDIMHDNIAISYPTIANALDKCEKVDDIDEIVRSLCYHEVAHSFITPRVMKIDDIMNIFEDERIETICKDYFHNVNFKRLIKIVNNFHGQKPKNAKEGFYQLVRFRIGPKDFLNKVSEIIIKYAQLDRNSQPYCTDSYYYDVHRLYHKYASLWGTSKIEDINDTEKVNAENEGIDDTMNIIKSDEKDDVDAKDEEAETKAINKIVNVAEIFEVANQYDDILIQEKFNKILKQATDYAKRNSSAICAYSGRFEPRLAARDDYKFFVQANRRGHLHANAKIKMNLFIDCSGSFYASDVIINKMLKALMMIEQQTNDFSFDLISCGMNITLRKKTDRYQSSYGGNRITNELQRVFASVQDASKKVINIVCFDGDALSDNVNYREGYYGAKAFNQKNVLIVSDISNEDLFNACAPNATKIYTCNYAKELLKTILTQLEKMLK